MTIDDARLVIAHGIPWRSIWLVCPVPTFITLDAAGERYEPDPAGCPAWVLPVCAADPVHPEWIETAEPEDVISMGATLDLIAFAPGAWPLGIAARRGPRTGRDRTPIS
jgi:hypothetical protein